MQISFPKLQLLTTRAQQDAERLRHLAPAHIEDNTGASPVCWTACLLPHFLTFQNGEPLEILREVLANCIDWLELDNRLALRQWLLSSRRGQPEGCEVKRTLIPKLLLFLCSFLFGTCLEGTVCTRNHSKVL